MGGALVAMVSAAITGFSIHQEAWHLLPLNITCILMGLIGMAKG